MEGGAGGGAGNLLPDQCLARLMMSNASLSGQTVVAVWPQMTMFVFGVGEESDDTSTHVTFDQIKGVLLVWLKRDT